MQDNLNKRKKNSKKDFFMCLIVMFGFILVARPFIFGGALEYMNNIETDPGNFLVACIFITNIILLLLNDD